MDDVLEKRKYSHYFYSVGIIDEIGHVVTPLYAYWLIRCLTGAMRYKQETLVVNSATIRSFTAANLLLVC